VFISGKIGSGIFFRIGIIDTGVLGLTQKKKPNFGVLIRAYHWIKIVGRGVAQQNERL
jgi:hypothetical protein